LHIIDQHGLVGANFKIHYKGNVVPFFLPNALGKPAVYAAAAAATAGIKLDINLVAASEALKAYSQPSGRLRLIEGIKQTRIIDDTYNSAPDSTIAALEALPGIAHSRKLAALGDMAELGSKSEAGHREIAEKIIENKIDIVFLIGPKTKATADELKNRQFVGQVYSFENSDQAKLPVQNTLEVGDTILVKGSQSMRMEKIVLEIMANPQQAPELLVRQTTKWLNKP
jgi:UDP-N-acetylmuramoyl-tripeptide--D-alanyl-D-alanine ligase